MRVGIIDADLILRKRHRFPNLACMKLSAHWKAQGGAVELLTGFEGLAEYDRVYLSKVFTDTPVPQWVLELPNVEYGGTGFFYDKAPALPYDVEHSMPDYHLYDDWVAGKPKAYAFYRDYSIGFLTRGCFRKCAFCVNRGYDRVCEHSPLEEFYDPARAKICLLDDNFLGHPRWREMLESLQATGKPFCFRQGLDERLLSEEKCEALFSSRYDGEYTFAFDHIADAKLVEDKIKLARRYTGSVLRFYCFCGFDRRDKWDAAFWRRDVYELLWRIRLLMQYHCLPYVMRFARYEESPYRGLYITLARWCNQPGLFKKKSLREYAELAGGASLRYLAEFERDCPEIAAEFYDLKYPR